MRLFGERPPLSQAKAFVRRRINDQCEKVRQGEDWRERFVLVPAVVPHQHGRYATRAWAVRLDGPEGELAGVIIWNYMRTQMQFRRPYGVWRNCQHEGGQEDE